MKSIIITSLISLVILLSNSPDSKKPFQDGLNNDKFFEINYENLLKQGKGTLLSQIASKVEYIQLETNKDCLLGPFAKYYINIGYLILVLGLLNGVRIQILKFIFVRECINTYRN